jgi:hypothetical protein
MGNADTRSYLCKVYGTAVLVFFPDAPETFSSVLISPHVMPLAVHATRTGGWPGGLAYEGAAPRAGACPPTDSGNAPLAGAPQSRFQMGRPLFCFWVSFGASMTQNPTRRRDTAAHATRGGHRHARQWSD